jgi:hypothetical protein
MPARVVRIYDVFTPDEPSLTVSEIARRALPLRVHFAP